jgi:hypothetical protein
MIQSKLTTIINLLFRQLAGGNWPLQNQRLAITFFVDAV